MIKSAEDAFNDILPSVPTPKNKSLNQESQEFLANNGQLSAMGSNTLDPADVKRKRAKDKIEKLQR